MVRCLFIVAVVACASSCTPAPSQPPPDEPNAPDQPAVQPDPCDGVVDVPPAQLSRLTPAQYSNTIGDLSGGAIVPPTLPNQLSQVATEAEVEAISNAAHALVAQGLHRPFLSCNPDDPKVANRQCVASFIDTFGLRLFRRPLGDDERLTLLAFYDRLTTSADFDPPLSFTERIDAVAEVMLTSPQFLYVHDDGAPNAQATADGLRPTTGFERASRLSLFLFDRAPDDELLSLAERGALDSDEGLRDVAAKMVLDPRARPVVRRFASAWLGLNATGSTPALEERAKSAASFPMDSPELRVAMRDEVESLYERIVFDGDGRFGSLFTTSDAKVTPALGQLYGMSTFANGWTELDGQRRAGILTRAAFLTQFAGPEITSPIRRGAHLYRNVLGLVLGDPPPNANLTPPAPGGDTALSTRQAAEQRTAPANCTSCHGLINPLGFAFEHYDALGRWRDDEQVSVNGEAVTVPIDSNTQQLASGVNGQFDGAVSLSARIAQSETAHRAHAARWFAVATGRPVQAEDACTLSQLDGRFVQSDDLRALLVDVATAAPTKFVRPDTAEATSP